VFTPLVRTLGGRRLRVVDRTLGTGPPTLSTSSVSYGRNIIAEETTERSTVESSVYQSVERQRSRIRGDAIGHAEEGRLTLERTENQEPDCEFKMPSLCVISGSVTPPCLFMSSMLLVILHFLTHCLPESTHLGTLAIFQDVPRSIVSPSVEPELEPLDGLLQSKPAISKMPPLILCQWNFDLTDDSLRLLLCHT